MATGPHEDDVRTAKREMVSRFLQAPAAMAAALVAPMPIATPRPADNIVGIGVAEKVVENRMTGELSVKVYVRQKLPLAEVAAADRIPKSIEGIATDVEEVGLVEASLQQCSTDRRSRQHPAPCGISIGVGSSAGTLGAVVRDWGKADNGKRYILSNNHVLASSNAGLVGEEVFQPGPLDGGIGNDHRVGALARFIPIGFGAADENMTDCAIAEIPPNVVLSEICSIGSIAGTIRAARDMAVWKHGRTTGLTRGVITDVDGDFRVGFPVGAAFFTDVILVRGLQPTTPFSDKGDSGSVILNRPQNRACGLLFATAGAADVTFANPIQQVLRRLRVRLL